MHSVPVSPLSSLRAAMPTLRVQSLPCVSDMCLRLAVSHRSQCGGTRLHALWCCQHLVGTSSPAPQLASIHTVQHRHTHGAQLAMQGLRLCQAVPYSSTIVPYRACFLNHRRSDRSLALSTRNAPDRFSYRSWEWSRYIPAFSGQRGSVHAQATGACKMHQLGRCTNGTQ